MPTHLLKVVDRKVNLRISDFLAFAFCVHSSSARRRMDSLQNRTTNRADQFRHSHLTVLAKYLQVVRGRLRAYRASDEVVELKYTRESFMLYEGKVPAEELR